MSNVPDMAEHNVDDPAGGSNIEVSTADIVRVSLPENATTGYLWGVVDHGEGLEVIGEEHLAGESTPGAAGRYEVRVRAVQPGSWMLRLGRRRSWEDTAADERELTVLVG